MNQNKNLEKFNFKIISTSNLVLHESFDSTRVEKIKNNISINKIFTNPILCVRQSAKSNRYIVLDGANRTTALQQLKFPFSLVQEFDYKNKNLLLDKWNHLLLNNTVNFWVKKFSKVLEFKEDKQVLNCSINSKVVKLYLLNGKKIFSAKIPGSLSERLMIINKISNLYLDKNIFKRISSSEFNKNTKFGKNETLLIYPHFNKSDVMKIAGENLFIPSGISRHIVNNRGLHINLPILILSTSGNCRGKNKLLEKHLQNLITNRRVRFYDGSIFLFDE